MNVYACEVREGDEHGLVLAASESFDEVPSIIKIWASELNNGKPQIWDNIVRTIKLDCTAPAKGIIYFARGLTD